MPNLDEAGFVVHVGRSLASGDFLLIITGNDIRSDVQTMTTHLHPSQLSPTLLALLEILLWQVASGRRELTFAPNRTAPFEARMLVKCQSLLPDEEQRAWLKDAASRLANLGRPNLAQWVRTSAER